MKTVAIQITRVLLLALVALSLGAWGMRTFARQHVDSASQTQLASDGLIVVNFHGATRCNGCIEIGKVAQTVIETDFTDALRSGRLKWSVINFEEPTSRHFIKDYGIVSSTVVLVRREHGKDIEFRRLDAVWDHLFDNPAMKAYLRNEITALKP